MHSHTRLRLYCADDLEAAIALWHCAWTTAMPEVDFTARLAWWRERWLRELVPNNRITVADRSGSMVGFVVIDPVSGWLDQIVVDPRSWGAGVADHLIAEAKRSALAGIQLDVNQSNRRAIRFYERMGFTRIGTGTNPTSGAPTFLYEWKPA